MKETPLQLIPKRKPLQSLLLHLWLCPRGVCTVTPCKFLQTIFHVSLSRLLLPGKTPHRYDCSPGSWCVTLPQQGKETLLAQQDLCTLDPRHTAQANSGWWGGEPVLSQNVRNHSCSSWTKLKVKHSSKTINTDKQFSTAMHKTCVHYRNISTATFDCAWTEENQ